MKLKDGSYLMGAITGFYKGEEERGEPYILAWKITEATFMENYGDDGFGYKIGKIILQRNIKEVYFEEDKTIVKY